MKFKESTQWFKLFYVATAVYRKNMTKISFNIHERYFVVKL